MPMRRRSAYSSARAERAHVAAPNTLTLPAVGRIAPVIRRSSVVLPVPLGPMIAVMRPRATVRFRPSNIGRPPIA